MHSTNKISMLFALVFILVVGAGAQFPNDEMEDYAYEDAPDMNESYLIIPSIEITNSTHKPPSLSTLLKTLSTKRTSLSKKNKTMSSIFSKNRTTSLSKKPVTTQKIPTTVPPFLTPYALANNLVNQFNNYRNTDILTRIKQCDSNMQLNDMCEIYSFNNHTYSLIRESTIEFQSLEHIYDALVERMIVEKLNKFCPIGQWCLGNLTHNDIRYTVDVLRQHGRSFCSLEKCYHRLFVHAATCPSISTQNISTPTLKLLPMLCTLSKEQQTWAETECINQIVFLLHMLYAFWPQLETCHHTIAAGSDGCTAECLTFDNILHNVENQCSENASFLTRVPTLAWFRLIDLKQRCRYETIATKSPFISSVQNFISENMIWYRFHQRPVHVALFIIIIFCIVISFSLCLYVMSKNDYDSNTRRFDDDYEYTRLHDSTFELGANTEIPNESHADLNGNHRFTEHQRLL